MGNGTDAVYLEGALERALKPLVRPVPRRLLRPLLTALRRDMSYAPRPPKAFSTPSRCIGKVKPCSARQLGAFSVWHLVNIVRANNLSDLRTEELDQMTSAELIELIVVKVRMRTEEPISG